LLTNNKRVIFI